MYGIVPLSVSVQESSDALFSEPIEPSDFTILMFSSIPIPELHFCISTKIPSIVAPEGIENPKLVALR